jgi:prophage regulatory protein
MNIYSQFLRLKQVRDMTCLSKSSIYRLMEEGDFPRQVPLGARSVVWVKSQVEDWMSKKVALAQGSRT